MEVMEGNKCPSSLKDGKDLIRVVEKYTIPDLSPEAKEVIMGDFDGKPAIEKIAKTQFREK